MSYLSSILAVGRVGVTFKMSNISVVDLSQHREAWIMEDFSGRLRGLNDRNSGFLSADPPLPTPDPHQCQGLTFISLLGFFQVQFNNISKGAIRVEDGLQHCLIIWSPHDAQL